jgi:histidyl-tRNA synthetase
MNKCPDANIILDLSLVRGIAYYTGMVFEIISTKDKNLQVLCGGGRYDGLVKALGGPEEISALGFAYTLENLFGDEF